MSREDITELVARQLPEAKPGPCKQLLEFIVDAGHIRMLADYLKQNPLTKMDYLFCLTAADRKDGLNVLYFMTSSVYHHSVLIRVILADKAHPVVPTVSDLWKAAEFYEREVFDLFGIHFENHPDLRRIFLSDDWVGFPLRKDYKDTFTLER
ncbi:MAG: NADH-quinone oxidoreductase subunit C [Cyclobacteriaceae bacterium]